MHSQYSKTYKLKINLLWISKQIQYAEIKASIICISCCYKITNLL